MAPVLIALGSNLGDRLDNLQRAIDALDPYVRLESASRVYETEPMYVVDQPAFYNAALLASTERGPLETLRLLKWAEQVVGRQPAARNGPREIDLDLIAYGSLRFTSTGADRSLQIPHPRVPERRFVLLPAFDVAPTALLPGLGRIDALLAATNDQAGAVCLVDDAVLSIHRHR